MVTAASAAVSLAPACVNQPLQHAAPQVSLRNKAGVVRAMHQIPPETVRENPD